MRVRIYTLFSDQTGSAPQAICTKNEVDLHSRNVSTGVFDPIGLSSWAYSQ